MANYAFTITSPEAEEIKIGYDDDSVQSINVSLDTLDDNVTQKSTAMVARISIRGAITPGNSKALTEIFKWAKDFKRATTYREIKIESRGLEDDTPRTYEMDKVFICDYSEFFGISKEGDKVGDARPSFEMKLTQFQNDWEGVKIY